MKILAERKVENDMIELDIEFEEEELEEIYQMMKKLNIATLSDFFTKLLEFFVEKVENEKKD
jgi:hypothetical protein